MRPRLFLILLAPALFFVVLVSCLRPAPQAELWSVEQPAQAIGTLQAGVTPMPGGFATPTRDPNRPAFTPTANPGRELPPIRTEAESYTVEAGDFLARIAQNYNVTVEQLIEANPLDNPNLLSPGQVLTIPAPIPMPPGPSMKIIPDSELVRGPANAGFDVAEWVQAAGGYLSRYSEEVDGRAYRGGDVLNRVAVEYSVNPRLLLALVEYQSGLVTGDLRDGQDDQNMLAIPDNWPRGLYSQLSWTANQLNIGYYRWQLNRISHFLLNDGAIVPPAPTLNAGTAAVQHVLALLHEYGPWQQSVSQQGVYNTYQALFGFPFDYAIEPLVPAGLTQPAFLLPFEPDLTWYFTGGPHGGYGSGSGWAALDFAPPGQAGTCNISSEWVTAVADGLVTYSDGGLVLLDLDGDGFDTTGWVVLYLHIDSQDRVQPGTFLRAGERIGRPSCEGGVSAATHVHIARRYNGEWVAADREVPFNFEGWISQSTGSEYNGVLIRDEQVVEAWDRRTDNNQIQR
jgi:LysM repeat protein